MKPLNWLLAHKLLVGLSVAVLAGGGIWWKQTHKPTEPPRYLLTGVVRGTIVTSVKGSGQVSGQNQLELKPLVSGAITKILVQSGQEVKANDPLFEIDTKAALKTIRDATQAVADARISLSSAQLSYNKLKLPPDTVSVTQAQNTLNQAQRDLQKLLEGPNTYDVQQAETELASLQQSTRISSDGKTPNLIRNAYDTAVPVLKSIGQSLQQSLYDADAVIGIDNTSANDSYEHQLSITDSSKLPQAVARYQAVKQAVQTFTREADALNATNEDPSKIDAALLHAQTATNLMSPFLQAVYDTLLATVTSPTFTQASLTSLQNSIQSDHSETSSKLTTITTQIQALASARTSFTSAEFNVQKSQASLDKLKAGADAKDIASARDKVTAAEQALAKVQKGTDQVDLALSQNSVEQRRSALNEAQNKLVDAQQALKDYVVRAPFDGILANLTVHLSDQASPSTVLATLVTPTKLAQISLNEVDATKIHVGQKATLTFDAIPDLTIAGSVFEVNPLGTVTQGVVNYAVKVAFQTQDERIKSGMSASVSIITAAKTDILVLPNAAVRYQGASASVQVLASTKQDATSQTQGVLSDTPPQLRMIEVGLSNEENTEIMNGLAEGDQVVLRTIDPSATTARTTTQTNNALRIPGLGGGTFNAGGGVRPAGGVGR